MIKIEKNYKGFDRLKKVAERIANEINKGARFATKAEMTFYTGCRAGNEKAYYYNIDEMYYEVRLSKAGNIVDVIPFAQTFKGKEQEIGQYEVVGEYFTHSDAGSHLINGLLFSNNYGDGSNKIEVRKFQNNGGRYHSRLEIYEETQVVNPHGTLKIWSHDCADTEKVEPMLTFDNAFKVIICDRKVIVCVA